MRFRDDVNTPLWGKGFWLYIFLVFPKILVFDIKFVQNNFNNIKLQAPDILNIALNTASLFLW